MKCSCGSLVHGPSLIHIFSIQIEEVSKSENAVFVRTKLVGPAAKAVSYTHLPSFPTPEELEIAGQVFVLSVKLVSVDKILESK